MFSLPPFSELKELVASRTAGDVLHALKSPHPDLSDLAALLSPAADGFLEQTAARSSEITMYRFGKTIQIYAPVYLSNFCTNQCLYCGFSAGNRIDRRKLSLEEAESEAMILHNRGFNHILLVSGDAPKAMGVDYFEALALRLRERFASVSIEVQPLETDEYARLFAAGITGVAVYQETYEQKTYKEIHLSGKKCDYEYRLDIPARAAEAGMREVGIGVLLGLSDWRADALALGFHLAWLRKRFWKTAFTVSFPRLRPAEGDFTSSMDVSERNLAQMLFAMRIFDQDVGLILSTREESRFRDGMIGLGPTRYSAGSCTAPGGYGNPDLTGEQFSIGDHRLMAEVCSDIKNRGFDPVCKDWDMTFQLH